MEQETEYEGEMRFEETLDYVEILNQDSKFFINREKKSNANFSLNKDEDTISVKEREIRWHLYVNKILQSCILKIQQLEAENTELKKFKDETLKKQKTFSDTGLDMLNCKSVLTAQMEACTKALEVYVDNVKNFQGYTEIELDNLKESMKSQTVNPSSQDSNANVPKIMLKPPKFGGMDYEKPMHFLSELKKYISITKMTNADLSAIFQQCLEKRASQWFYTIEHKINDMDDFEEYFKERFWNEPIKSALRIRLEAGQYNKDQKKSRVQYAEDMITEIKELEMKLTEEDMIKKISRHFGPEIARVIRIQMVCKLGQFYDLLQEFDNTDHPRKYYQSNYSNEKSNNKNRKFNSPNDKKSSDESEKKDNSKNSENKNFKQYENKTWENSNNKNNSDKKGQYYKKPQEQQRSVNAMSVTHKKPDKNAVENVVEAENQ